MRRRADSFYAQMEAGRSVRDFSDRPVPRELIERAIQTAEDEERENYERRMSWAFAEY